jgi:hypothetical protein
VKKKKSALRAKLQFIGHLITGFTITFEGVSELGPSRETGPFAVLILISGLAVLIVTLGHGKRGMKFRHSRTVLYAAESLVSFIIAILYAREGKTAVQYPFFFAALLLAGLMGFSLSRPDGSRPRVR